MKLIACHIENFGGLSQVDCTFGDGLTALYAPNGGGKSTLAAFIRAMFYGLPADTSRSRFNDRRHFCPFSGGKFGGNITFEWKGRVCRVERFFDRGSGDEVRAFADGKPYSGFADGQIGRAVFGLDEPSFVRTLYVDGAPLPLEATGGITSRLSQNVSAAAGGDDLPSALAALARASKNLQSRGNRGRIAELEARIKRLGSEEADICAVSDRLGERYAERAELVARLDEYGRRERGAAELSAQRAAGLEEMRGAIAGKREELAGIDGRFPLGLPTREELDGLAAAGTKGRGKGAGVRAFPLLFALVLAAGCIAAGAVLLSGMTAVGIAAICAGALFVCVAACIFAYGAKKRKKIGEEATRILKRYGLEGEDCAAAGRTLARAAERRRELIAEISAGEERMRAYADGASSARPDPREGEVLRRRLAVVERDIADDESITEGLGELRAARLEAQSQLEECKKKYSAYTAAAELLAEAERSLTRDLVRPAAEAFARYSSLLRNTLGQAVYIDKNFAVAFEGGGELRSAEHMSGGQRAIVGLCYRLALADGIFGGEYPFVLLDDPFCELDEEHMSRAAALLNALAKDRQIIYLYCHASRKA